jgi:hypothetical protein
MSTVSFEAQNSGGTVAYADNGSYDVVGQWIEGGLDSLQVGGCHNYYQKVMTSGIDGQGTKNEGYRSNRHVLKAVYVGASEQDIIEQWLSDSGVLSANPSTLSYGNATLSACLFDGTASKLNKVKSCNNAAGMYKATADLVFESVR